jgi:hypothetical protein
MPAITRKVLSMRKVILGCLLLLTAGAAIGQIMECVDAKGTKTFAQYCPPGTVTESKLMKSGASGGPTSTTPAKSLAERDAEFKKRTLERQEAETKAEKEKSEARDNERNCLDARSQLRAIQDGQRIMRVDPKTGERTVLDDNDRPAELANAQKAVDQWCSKK